MNISPNRLWVTVGRRPLSAKQAQDGHEVLLPVLVIRKQKHTENTQKTHRKHTENTQSCTQRPTQSLRLKY